MHRGFIFSERAKRAGVRAQDNPPVEQGKHPAYRSAAVQQLNDCHCLSFPHRRPFLPIHPLERAVRGGRRGEGRVGEGAPSRSMLAPEYRRCTYYLKNLCDFASVGRHMGWVYRRGSSWQPTLAYRRMNTEIDTEGKVSPV